MSNLFDYNAVPASNNSTSPNGAPEGMSPSSLNDVQRQMMANSAGAFTCYTGGGTANAHTVTMSPTLAAYSNKVRIAYIPPANNTGAYTVNVNGLGAVSVKMLDGTDPPAGAANSSGVSVIQNNGTNFVLLNPAWSVPANHQSYGRVYLQTDGTAASRYDVDAVVTEGTFESIGPTSSGATNEYSGMNNIPTGAAFAIFLVELLATSNGTNLVALQFFARPTGSTLAAGDGTRVAHFFWDPDAASETGGYSALVFAPLNSSRSTDITWNFSNATTESVELAYRGFCI